jgi:mRNA interferase RelE/StbE
LKTAKYCVELETRARRELFDLPKKVIQTIADVFADLESNPRPSGTKKLTAHEGYRIRKGQYRILYTINDNERRVSVYRIGHRREIYR